MTGNLFLTGLVQGLILALITYAVMIPFRLLNFPDLTAEGAYPLGGAVCASALVMGINPVIAVLLSVMTAGALTMTTGLIHLRLKVDTLLAGIILSTMAYSVNLRILGKPNVALFESSSIFIQQNSFGNIITLLLILSITVVPLALFLKTEFGLKLRAVGLNSNFAKRQGISIAKYTMFGLFIAGCFTGLAAGFMVQLQKYMGIDMGVGIVIHALAALMIGEKLIGNDSLNKQLLAPLVGALIYQQIQGVALSIGLAPSDLKFFTGSLVLIVIAMQKKRSTCIKISRNKH